MTDRELLLERLERLAIVLDELMPQCAELVRDALTLLKKQEAITDKMRNRRCPSCGTVLKGKYCHECGQAILLYKKEGVDNG